MKKQFVWGCLILPIAMMWPLACALLAWFAMAAFQSLAAKGDEWFRLPTYRREQGVFKLPSSYEPVVRRGSGTVRTVKRLNKRRK